MTKALHDQRGKFVCAYCFAAEGFTGCEEYIPICLRCRTKAVFDDPKSPPAEMPRGRALEPDEIVARDLMLAAASKFS
jgi:hypothetical protein